MTTIPRIRSWMAPDAVGGPWFPIEAIRPEMHANVLLDLALADAQVIGCLGTRTEERPIVRYGVRTREAIRRVEWQEWRATSRALAPLCPFRSAVPGIRWTWREPRAFRPLDESQVALVLAGARSPVRAWPDGATLPAPLDGRIRQAPPPSSADEEPEPLPFATPSATAMGPARFDRCRAADGWPYADVALGDRISPASAEEAEARLLRAWRTAEAADRVAPSGSSTCADIPREMVMIARRYADADRRVEAFLKGLPDDPSLDALPARWEPERRDQNDCAYALDWLRHLAHPRALAIVALRAALPPFSWRQVGERVCLTGAGALKAHRAGCDVIVRAEARGPACV